MSGIDNNPDTGTISIRYFAWVRSRLNRSEDQLTIPAEGIKMADLMQALVKISDDHAAIFDRPDRLKMSINQTYVTADDTVRQGDEIAFFPPVTGG